MFRWMGWEAILLGGVLFGWMRKMWGNETNEGVLDKELAWDSLGVLEEILGFLFG